MLVLQYWAGVEQLDAYAGDARRSHLPVWRDFNRRVRDNGDVGIYHETYLVGPGHIESVYGNMPRMGLAAASGHVPLGAGRHSAVARRSGDPSLDAPAVEPY